MSAPTALKPPGAVTRQQWYAEGDAAYQQTLQSNTAFAATDVKAYVMARVAGRKPDRPKPVPFST